MGRVLFLGRSKDRSGGVFPELTEHFSVFFSGLFQDSDHFVQVPAPVGSGRQPPGFDAIDPAFEVIEGDKP
jgi:hypothetical protein